MRKYPHLLNKTNKNDAPNENKKREGKDIFLYTVIQNGFGQKVHKSHSDRADKEYPYLYVQK